MELEENMPLLEWLANNYKKFGAGLEIITDRSQVNQLCLKMKQLTTIWRVSAHVLRHLLTDACLFRREASMFEDLVALAECWDTLLTFRYALAVSLYFWNKLYFLFVFQLNCFSQCNATTWTMPTTTWTTTKLSKSSLQLKLFHHKNLHVGSTYLVPDVTIFPGIAVRYALCLSSTRIVLYWAQMSWTQYSHKYSVIRSCHLPSKWPRVQSFYVTMCLLEKTVTASLQCQACSLSRICPSNFQGFVPVKSRNLSQWRCLANPGGIQLEGVKIYDCKCCAWSFKYFIIFLWWLTNRLATLSMVMG